MRNPLILTIDSSDDVEIVYHSVMVWSIGADFKWTRPAYTVDDGLDELGFPIEIEIPEKRLTIALLELFDPDIGHKWGYICPEESQIFWPFFVDPNWSMGGHDGAGGKQACYSGRFNRGVPVFRSYRTKP